MRKAILQVVLGVVGVVFLATVYPMVMLMRQEPATSMMLSLYVTLGVFLLLAIRHPLENRSLIAYAGWSSLAHATVMTTQVMKGMVAHREMMGNYVFAAIGVLLLVLAPAKKAAEADA
jgi:succinate-acetate transporter protein